LDNKVTKLKDVVFKQDLDGIQDGVASIVKVEVTSDGALRGRRLKVEVTSDGAVCQVGAQCINTMTGVNVGVHGDSIHREYADGGWEILVFAPPTL
jgi:hypothetical protein